MLADKVKALIEVLAVGFVVFVCKGQGFEYAIGGAHSVMKITRSLSSHGTFCPAAVNILGEIPSQALFHIDHQLRHPESIYRISMQKLADAFFKVAEAYLEKSEAYRGSKPPETWEITQLLKDQEDLLRVLQEHLDDLWLILKTLVDPSSVTKKPIFADKYVVGSKLPGAKSFEAAIEGYKKSLRIANKLKHQQCCLRGVAIWMSGAAHLGYFLEEPDAKGYLGPSPEIHPDRGAISFARDLRWHLFNVYLCSEKLVGAIEKVLGSRGLHLSRAGCPNDPTWEKVIALGLAVPDAYFPKEIPKHKVSMQKDSDMLVIEFPKTLRLRFPADIRTSCSMQIDKHSRTYKVPFP
jgi:hypothetical protein